MADTMYCGHPSITRSKLIVPLATGKLQHSECHSEHLPLSFSVCTQAAIVADQNAKLSIFATRPAIYSPLYNFITETMGTVALLILVLLIEMQVG